MNHESLKYWMALKSIDGIGNASFQPLLDRFGSAAAVFSASASELAAVLRQPFFRLRQASWPVFPESAKKAPRRLSPLRIGIKFYVNWSW